MRFTIDSTLRFERVTVAVPNTRECLGGDPLRILSVLPNVPTQDFRDDYGRTTYKASYMIGTGPSAFLDDDTIL